MMDADQLRQVEMELLLDGIARVYGYDFREYAEGSLGRCLRQWLSSSSFATFSAAQGEILRDADLFEGLLSGLTINVSDMFRDPEVFRIIREQVAPHLKTYPFLKIWHAGCASGEEVYSMALLLEEEGLGKRYRIYGTDINRAVLTKAKDGIFSLKQMEGFARNYRQSGGGRSFADYFLTRYQHAMINPELKKNMVFAPHNLAVDGVFGEMQLVVCRNVLIYFKESLKERALELLDAALVPGGFLCLGNKETLEGRRIADRYLEVAPHSRIYRKRYQ